MSACGGQQAPSPGAIAKAAKNLAAQPGLQLPLSTDSRKVRQPVKYKFHHERPHWTPDRRLLLSSPESPARGGAFAVTPGNEHRAETQRGRCTPRGLQLLRSRSQGPTRTVHALGRVASRSLQRGRDRGCREQRPIQHGAKPARASLCRAVHHWTTRTSKSPLPVRTRRTTCCPLRTDRVAVPKPVNGSPDRCPSPEVMVRCGA